MLKNVLRFAVAIIFIISGFVKAVDVIGFSFKLEEYFEPSVFNIPFMVDLALPLAIFVVGLELLLGFMLLLKIKLKQTLIALIALCIFFAFLTFYSAFFNVVTDCGCFGDALKLEPWQSFWKDIILLVALFIIYFLYSRHPKKFTDPKSKVKSIVVSFFSALMTFIIMWGILHEPVIDFRDYKIGTDLNAERAKIQQDPSVFKSFYSMKNTKTGETLLLNQDDFVNDKKYWEDGTAWEIEEGKTTSKIVKEGYASEIAKFKIEDETGNDITADILKAPKAIILFSYKPKQADKKVIADAEAKMKTEKNAYLIGVSTEPKTFKTINNGMMDGTATKTIARSNPFVLILENGKITHKESANDYLR